MPTVASLEALERAAAEFEIGDTWLVIEPQALAAAIGGYLAGQPLADDMALWSGDGRITAGHLAVLRERATAGPLDSARA